MHRGGLFLKYLIPLVLLSAGGLLAHSLIELYFSYQENKTALGRIQGEKAANAAIRIEQFVREIEHQLVWIAQTPWEPAGASLDHRRLDSLRLLRHVPAVTEVSHLDPSGHEQLRVSRLAMDVMGSNTDYSSDPKFKQASSQKTYFSRVYFRKESEPYMTIALAGRSEGAGVVAAEANLKFIWDVVSRMEVGTGGYAYVLDDRGQLIAHPDISLVLQKTDFSVLPQVRAAGGAVTSDGVRVEAITGLDLKQSEVLSAHAAIAPLGWKVFVDRPIEEALAPLYASMLRTAGLLIGGLVISIVASLVLVRRMVKPIQTLQAGAARIGAGALDHRITVATGDELEALGDDFNDMTARLQDSYAGLERKVDERTHELREALEQQTATSEILRVISASPTDRQPVFDTIVRNATRLCDAAFAVLHQYDGHLVTVDSYHNVTGQELDVGRRVFPRPRDRDYAAGRAVLDRAVVHIPDIHKDPEYRIGDLLATSGFATVLAVPLMREDHPIGALCLWRRVVSPFSDTQIALVKTFADQAVIAIENVRLFNELQERNKALTEALEQQTATSEILRAISSSPTDIKPIMDAVGENAARLGGADDAAIYRVEPDGLRLVAQYGSVPSIARDERLPIRRDLVIGRAILDRQIMHVPDIAALSDDEFTGAKALHARFGYRSILIAPMLRKGEAIGAIAIRCMEVRPFSEKQIALISTFADQAVIAIENVRLFQELQARTEELASLVAQLKALAEVSQAVNSTLDLEQVLLTIVARAVELSAADSGAVYEFDDERRELQLRATHGLSPEVADALLANAMPLGKGAVGAAAERRAPVEIVDLRATKAYEGRLRTLIDALPVRAVLAVPLLQESRVVGALSVGKNIPGSFPPGVLDLLQTFAVQSTLAIQNARLFREIERKSRELESASQHKSDFLANMSHELRTPLNAIIGFSEVLKDGLFGELSDKQAEYMRDIHSSGHHLLSLINDILDLAKVEAGHMELTVAAFDVPAAIDNAVMLVRERASRHQLALEVQVDQRLNSFAGDERKFKQILLNLLSNAIKFTPEGGRVSVSAQPTDIGVQIAVQDTGIGIATQDQAVVFEAFRQVTSEYNAKREGTGLGLALVKQFVEMHGGSVSLQSTPAKGSTFTFTLAAQPLQSH